jgi:hypothetical protein
MYYYQIDKINSDIERTKKAIVALGCSYVQGQGAVDDKLYADYEWRFEGLGVPLKINLDTIEEKRELLQKYPNIILKDDETLDYHRMEYNNAFCNVLAKKYFNDEYAAINLGIRGCGNRATIKELHMHSEIDWHKLEEIVVIYCPSGLERFDFANDCWNEHHHWVAMWPHYKDESLEEGPRKILSEGYARRVYSEKSSILEQIANVMELVTWCKLHNARLIITPGFDKRYTLEHFTKHTSMYIEREWNGEMKPITGNVINDDNITELNRMIQLWPWEDMFYPDGLYPTFADLCMGQEFPNDWERRSFFHYNGKSSPNGWITSCAHPSAKAHDLFAKKLFEYITS